MNNQKNGNTSKAEVVAQVAALARTFATTRGHGKCDAVGAYVLIGAIAKCLGAEAASQILGPVGVKDVDGLLAVVPQAFEDDLPPLHPDDHLKNLIRNQLAGFFKGTMSAEEALRVLVAPENLTPEAQQFLANPRAELRDVADTRAWVDTRAFLRNLSAFYQKRYRLGWLYYGAMRKSGLSDFVSGESDEAFGKAVEDVYAEEAEAKKELFDSSDYRRSPLAALRQQYGEDDVHILTAALLAEIGQVSDGPLSVRELAWVMDPKYFHRTLGAVRNQIRHLRMLGAVELLPDAEDNVRLYHRVLVAEEMVDEFLRFLREADGLTVAEIEDYLMRGL